MNKISQLIHNCDILIMIKLHTFLSRIYIILAPTGKLFSVKDNDRKRIFSYATMCL